MTKRPEDLTPEALEVLQRVLRLMEHHREEFAGLGGDHLFSRLFDRIQFGADPADPDFEQEWVIP